MDPKSVNLKPSAPTPSPLIRQGKLAYWITVHKIPLRRGGIFALGLLGGVMLVYGAIGLVNYYGVELPRAREEARELARPSIPADVLASFAPKPLEVKSVQLVAGQGQKMDAFAYVTNPNPRVVAEFSYTFSHASGASEKQSSFLLPGETRPLIGSGIPESGSVNLTITDLQWTRLRPQEVQDPAAYIKTRLNFKIVSTDYQAALPIDSTQIGRVQATIRNDGAYGYWKPQFVVLISRAGRVVGVSRASIDRFLVNDERTLEATWIPSPGAADKIEIIPEVNVFDPSVYLSPSS